MTPERKPDERKLLLELRNNTLNFCDVLDPDYVARVLEETEKKLKEIENKRSNKNGPV